MLRPLALAATLACPGCGAGLFACFSDEDCQGDGTAGTCAAAGACAFPDEECESGQRYGDHAGDMSGRCVPVEGTTSSDGWSDPTSAGSPTSLDVSTSPEDGADTTDPDTGSTSTPLGTSTTDVDPTATITVTDTANDESTTGEPVDPDLLVWLRFDQLENDSSIANEGTLAGAATCVEDCPELADGIAEFDGLGDCLAFPSHDLLVNTPFTAAAWVHPTDAAAGMFLFGKAVELSSQNSWEFYISYEIMGGQTLGFEMYAPPDVVISAEPPPLAQWSHIAGSWDGQAMTLFVDGQIVGEAMTIESTWDGHDVRIGCDDDGGVSVYPYEGWLTDMRIYGRALQTDEIAELASTPPGDPT